MSYWVLPRAPTKAEATNHFIRLVAEIEAKKRRPNLAMLAYGASIEWEQAGLRLTDYELKTVVTAAIERVNLAKREKRSVMDEAGAMPLA